ncbi:MAG: hypothetical protein LUC90_05775, partial [Lachnospiraceae bacterium]|nr:hypothetical protein [Lachnospiraceae bacterium]
MKNDTKKDTSNSNTHESEGSGLDSHFRYRVIAVALIVFITAIILMGIYYVMFHPDKLSSVISSLSEIFRPVLFGFVIAYLMTPVLNWMEQKHVKPFIEKHGLKSGSRGNSMLIT